MRIAGIVFAILIGLLGFRLISTGLRTFMMVFKAEEVSLQARQRIFRDIILGLLFIVLAIVILI